MTTQRISYIFHFFEIFNNAKGKALHCIVENQWVNYEQWQCRHMFSLQKKRMKQVVKKKLEEKAYKNKKKKKNTPTEWKR